MTTVVLILVAVVLAVILTNFLFSDDTRKPPPTQPNPDGTPPSKAAVSQWQQYAGCCVNNSCPWTNSGRSSSMRQMDAREPRVCTTIGIHPNRMIRHLSRQIPMRQLQALSPSALRAAFLKAAIWPQQSVLKVGFVRDNNYSKAKADWVRDSVEKYLVPLINLSFSWDYQPVQNAQIRITFDSSHGAYSAVGTEALSTDSQETMNLGWLDTANEGDYDFPEAKGMATVVVHEFGHALGMIHEHNREDAALPWNCQAVYDWLSGPPNNWSKDIIDGNVFQPVSMSELNSSEYDAKSIMHYWFPQKFFVEKVDLPQNIVLSVLDKVWLAKTYPKEGVDIAKITDDGTGTSTGTSTGTKSSNILTYIIVAFLLILAIVLGMYFIQEPKLREESS